MFFALCYLKLLTVLTFSFSFLYLVWVRSSLHRFILQCCIPLLLYASRHHLILMQTIRLFRCCLWLIYCLVVYTSTPLRVHACMPLRIYASTHLRLGVYLFVPFYPSFPILLCGFTSLLLYASTALRLYALNPLRLYACKIVVLYSSVSYWGGYNRYKREAEIEPRVKGRKLIFEASSVKQILTQTFQ